MRKFVNLKRPIKPLLQPQPWETKPQNSLDAGNSRLSGRKSSIITVLFDFKFTEGRKSGAEAIHELAVAQTPLFCYWKQHFLERPPPSHTYPLRRGDCHPLYVTCRGLRNGHYQSQNLTGKYNLKIKTLHSVTKILREVFSKLQYGALRKMFLITENACGARKSEICRWNLSCDFHEASGRLRCAVQIRNL